MEGENRAQQLAETVLDNLKYQHDWTELKILTHSPTPSSAVSGAGAALTRPIITGLPPRRLYVHPDDQIRMVKSSGVPNSNGSDSTNVFDTPETEWVLATHISEKWTVRALAGVFDSLPAQQHQSLAPGPERPKRIVLATIHNDSTVVYYILHDGIVKPRQN